MIRRFASLQRNNARHPLISSASRLGHVLQLRAGDPIGGIIGGSPVGVPVNLAPDRFAIGSTVTVSSTCTVVGQGYGTEVVLRGNSAGPAMEISADKVIIEGIRFVYNDVLPATSLITRPVRCSGETYNPAALSASLSSSALFITGDNVTIRNCWFEGFDNAIYTSGSYTAVEGCYFSSQSTSTKSSVYLAGTHGSVRHCHSELAAYGVYASGNYSSISDNSMIATESGIFVTSDYNRIHGNLCAGHADGFAMTLTVPAQYNAVTGNVASAGTYYFISPATSYNQYGANAGTVDIE